MSLFNRGGGTSKAEQSRQLIASQAGARGLQDIIAQFQAAQDKANQANELRYQQALGQFENLGKAGQARIEQQTTQRQAEATQNLTSRGLGNTTITSAVSQGIADAGEQQRQQLDESVASQKAGLIERRTDAGPDAGLFASMLQIAGQGQASAGGGTTIRRMGPMASRGLSIFGQPLTGSGSKFGR